MPHIPGVLRLSPIHGLGLIAQQLIAQSTDVWRFTAGFDLDVDPALVDPQPEPFRSQLPHYGSIDPQLGRYIPCRDDARFINHSGTPNLRADFSRETHGVDIAVRDIAAGEELTVDYNILEGTGHLRLSRA